MPFFGCSSVMLARFARTTFSFMRCGVRKARFSICGITCSRCARKSSPTLGGYAAASHLVASLYNFPMLPFAHQTRIYLLLFRCSSRVDLAILVEGDKRLFNQYGVMLVNPGKRPHVKAKRESTSSSYPVGVSRPMIPRPAGGTNAAGAGAQAEFCSTILNIGSRPIGRIRVCRKGPQNTEAFVGEPKNDCLAVTAAPGRPKGLAAICAPKVSRRPPSLNLASQANDFQAYLAEAKRTAKHDGQDQENEGRKG